MSTSSSTSATAQQQNHASETGPIARPVPLPFDAAPATTIDPDSARPGLPVLPPLTAILEILLLIVLPAVLDYALPAFPSLTETQPHLFWLPVLLVSLQYGTLSGLLAAGTAIAASSVLGWSDQEIGENHFSYLVRVWSQPMLWLMAALVLGQFRMRQIERKQELSRQVAELSSQRQAIADYAVNLRDRCERLERETALQRSLQNRDVLVLLGRLQQSDPETARTAFQDCLRMAFGPCQAAVFARTGDEFQLLQSVGWPANASWSTTLAADHPLTRAIIHLEHSPCVLVPGEEHILAAQGLAATPVYAPDGTHVIGLLKLEAADPFTLDASLVDRMKALAVQIGPRLQSGAFTAGSTLPTPTSGARATGEPASHRPRLWRQVRWQRPQTSSLAHRRPARAG